MSQFLEKFRIARKFSNLSGFYRRGVKFFVSIKEKVIAFLFSARTDGKVAHFFVFFNHFFILLYKH